MNPLTRLGSRIKQAFSGGFGSFLMSMLNPGSTYSRRQFMELYQGIVHACVSVIAENVAKYEPQLFRIDAKGERVEVNQHEFLNLFHNPNPLQSKYEFLELAETYRLIAGETFIYMPVKETSRIPVGFYLLSPDRIQVAVDEDSDLPRISGYVYTNAKGVKVPLEADEIEHSKLPNPLNPYRGLGKIEAGIVYVLTEKYGAEFTRNYIYNNGMPPGILNIKANISEPEFQKVKKQFQQQYGSLQNAGKVAVLKGSDVEFTKIGTSLSEVALKELKDMSQGDIRQMFKVPKAALGNTDDVNRASAEAALYSLAINVIDPSMLRWTDTFQRIVNRWSRNNQRYVVDYVSPIPEDQDRKLARYTAGHNVFLTTNEIRREEGLPDLPGGDVLLQPFNLAPIGDPAPANKSLGKIKITKRYKKDADTGTAPPDPNKGLPVEAKENFRLELMKNQELFEGKFKNLTVKYLAAQRRKVISNLESRDAKKLGKAFEGYLFDFDEETAEFKKILQPLMSQLILDQGLIALRFAGSDLDFEFSESVKRSVEASVGRMSRNYNQETIERLSKTILEGLNAGEDIGKMKGRIEDVYAEARGYRAERIARTETLKGSNYATNEAYRQTGYVVYKKWYANPGHCEICAEFDGKRVGIDSVFAPQGTTVDYKDSEGKERVFNLDYEDIETPPLAPELSLYSGPGTGGRLNGGYRVSLQGL